jgi:2-oxoglutarate ferredoxin oxidoreductase subunit beta
MSTTELVDADAAHCVRAFAAKDFKSGAHPIWCPGCGDFGVLAALERALARHGRPPHEVVLVSGIGCSSRLPAYTSCYGFHGVHGRALAVATGLKIARPDLEVIAVGGDGDGYSIGGNHFIHACRRNVDMLYIVMDNRVYGMTKGQPSPTSEPDWDSEIAPGGIGLRPFNPLSLAIAAGANFVARAFSSDTEDLAAMIVEGLRWPGFAFLEVLSPCITFRPEETEWKARARPPTRAIEGDRAAAIGAVLSNDDFSMGVLFRGERAPIAKANAATATLAEIEAQFAVGG